MTPWELGLASGLYLMVAFRYLADSQPGMALAFVSYALANAGFIWAAVRS